MKSWKRYNDYLIERFTELFPLDQIVAFFEANEHPRPVTIRTNTLKARRRELAQALINRGVNLDPVGKWSKVNVKIIDNAEHALNIGWSGYLRFCCICGSDT